jgi:hypothetical protein
MESTWSALAVVAVVFTLFSGAAAAWDRLQARRRQRLEANWRSALRPQAAAPAPRTEQAAAASALPAAAAPAVFAAVAAPTVAATTQAAAEMQVRRQALDLALDRMTRPAAASAAADSDSPLNEWPDTQPMVAKASIPEFEPTRPLDLHD